MPRRLLAQLRPDSTSAVTLFSPSTNRPYSLDLIIATNNTSSAVDITLYHDAAGSTYDDTTCVLATAPLKSGETLQFYLSTGLADYRAAGGLGVKTSTADSVAFTVYGELGGESL